MGLRHGLLACFSLIALAASAMAQTLPQPPITQAARPVKVAQATVPAAQKAKPAQPAVAPRSGTGQNVAQSNVPHTLAEALAATYSNQPALQAERAKLRATDENVPTALAGWRPTVILAGTAGYGDGLTRSFSFATGRCLPANGRSAAG